MPAPAAHRLWTCAFMVLAGAGTVRAQYKGGNGDGFSSLGLANVYLDGGLSLSPAYLASTSGGDGYSVAGRGSVVLNGTTLPAAVFVSSSGGGDGYDSRGLTNLTLNGATLPAAVYTATSTGGDGYDSRGLANRSLDGAASLLTSYSGGNGDGYDTRGVFEIPFNINLAFGFIFSGGNGDGYDTKGIGITTLNSAALPAAVYTSSTAGGDGYDTRGLANNRLDGAVLPSEIYTSSVAGGDGYDVSGTSFANLSGVAAVLVTYLGANGDGYDTRGLANLLLNPALALPAFVFSGGNGDGYDTKSVPYIFYLGEGGVPGPMTYAIWRDVHFSAADIAAGLAADHADADHDGLVNLVEYTTGGDPRTADSGIFGPQFRLSDLSDFGRPALPDKHLTVIVRRDPRIFDATLNVEFSSDTISLWNAADAVPVNGTSTLFIVRDRLGLQDAPRRLLRLRATVNP